MHERRVVAGICSYLLATGLLIPGAFVAHGGDAAGGPPATTNRDTIRSEYGIVLLDADRLDDATQVRALEAILRSLPPGALPRNDFPCPAGKRCLNSIRVRDLLVGTNALGDSPYQLSTVARVDEWWSTCMAPQGYMGPNIFYDFETMVDYLERDDAPARSKYFMATAYHELMHGIDAKLADGDARYVAWRAELLYRLGVEPENYIRSGALEKYGNDYYREHPNELVPGLMNAGQQGMREFLDFCLSQDTEMNGLLIMSQCLGLLDVLSESGYREGSTSRGISTDATGGVAVYPIPVSRDPLTGHVDGFVTDGDWHRYELDEFGLPIASLDLECGDVDGDGRDKDDYRHVLLASRGMATCSAAVCDIDRDGRVTASDARAIRRTLRSPYVLPCEMDR